MNYPTKQDYANTTSTTPGSPWMIAIKYQNIENENHIINHLKRTLS